MNKTTVPDGYHAVTPYLLVPGVARVVDFLTGTFDAVERHRSQLPNGRIAHVEIVIDGSTIMLGEPPAGMPPVPAALYVFVADCDATYRRALASGGTSITEPADQHYGDRMAGVKDAAGNIWWIGQRKENLTHNEIDRRMGLKK